jgi:N-acetylneuraminic acid mutarotase
MDLETYTWSEIVITGTVPIPRNNHRTATYGNKIYVQGGHDGSKWLDDLFIFDTSTCNWNKVNITGYKPSARACHSLNRIKKKLYM